MIAEGNLQQKKGCKLCAYQLILLSNAKKKMCLPAVALLCFPRTNNGKAVKVFLLLLFFVSVCMC